MRGLRAEDDVVARAMPTARTQRCLSGIVTAAIVLTFFNTWVLFEETVVDRYGLWEYLPYYRVGKLCSWDIGALALIVWFTVRTLRQSRRSVVESSGSRVIGTSEAGWQT